jgi:hypothetical protein
LGNDRNGLLVSKVSTENQATGTRVDEEGLVRLGAQYTRDSLITFTFRQLMTAFETFLFNFLYWLSE